jgi:hypothetical protein
VQTALGAELEIKTLLGELYGSYSSADAPGPLSLLERLNRMYLFQLGSGDDGDRRRRPPGPRPPGRDAGLLAADEIDEVIGWWASYLHPGGRPLARTKAADLLPTLAVQAGDEMLAEVLHDVRSNHRVALLVLGLEDAPGVLYGRDAPRCLHCHQQRIMFDKHATLGDVWCGNGGYHAGACHNDARWPDCRDQDGRITCRRSTRSQRHCYRWSHADLGLLRDGAR